MGIDFQAESTKNPDAFDKGDPNSYLKWALHGTAWERILALLHINLGILYDHVINYWSAEQVKDMYARICKVADDPYALYAGWKREDLTLSMLADIEELIHYAEDLRKLADYFKLLVDNECRITVF